MTDAAESDVISVVDAIIDDYAHHRRDDYFSHFATDATFVFHTSPDRLESRSEYEALWRSWEDENEFQVLSCRSSERRIQMFGDVGVFSHRVETVLRMDGVEEALTERETIVVSRSDGRWCGIHEHLSGIDAPTD